MSYIKADEVLPQHIIKIIQQYIDGENIYIPKKKGSRSSWGEKTGAKTELFRRNSLIYRDYLNGINEKEIDNLIRRASEEGKFPGLIIGNVNP